MLASVSINWPSSSWLHIQIRIILLLASLINYTSATLLLQLLKLI